jgi:hypothetical protein
MRMLLRDAEATISTVLSRLQSALFDATRRSVFNFIAQVAFRSNNYRAWCVFTIFEAHIALKDASAVSKILEIVSKNAEIGDISWEDFLKYSGAVRSRPGSGI